MKDFRPFWKDLAHRKAITRRDVIQHCILRAMRSKGDTEAVLKHLLHKAFRPRNFDSRPYRAIEETYATVREGNYHHSTILGTSPENIFDEGEWNEFNTWADSLRGADKLIRHYSYFFTRQDISPEYQLVQTAHAALELGTTLKPEEAKNLYFTCCGVANLEELEMIEHVLTSLGHRHIVFREPDIGNQKTSIAVAPIAENKRGVLRNYPLLSFNQPEEIIEVRALAE